MKKIRDNVNQWLAEHASISDRIANMLGKKEQVGQSQHKTADFLASTFDYHALRELLPYDLYDPEKQLFINKQSIGWGISLSCATGGTEEMVSILSSVLTDVLPAGGNLQILFCGSNKIGPMLDQVQQHCSQREGVFSKLAQLQINHLKQGASQSLVDSEDYYLRDMQLFCFFSLPQSHPQAQLESLQQLRADTLSSLQSINLFGQVLSVESFLSLMNELLSPNKTIYPEIINWNQHESLANQITDPEVTLQIAPGELRFNKNDESTIARCFTVKRFPKQWRQWQMGEMIGQLFNSALQIPCPYLINLNIHLIDAEAAARQVQTKLMGKDSKANSPLSKWLPQIGRECQDWQWLREQLSEGGKTVQLAYQVVLLADEKQINRAERKLHDLYNANGWRLAKPKHLQWPLFLSILPMTLSEGLYKDLRYFGQLKTMTAFNAVNLAPLQGEWKGYPNSLMILPGRRGQIAGWNPFSNTQGNYNVAVAAGSGKGKSTFIQSYILSLVGSGGRCWVIDMGHSYEKTCHLLNGEFIEFHKDHPVCLNPFTMIRDEEDFKTCRSLLVPLIAVMARSKTQTSEEEDAFIEKAINGAWEEKGSDSTITTVRNYLDSLDDPIAKNLANLLVSYCEGGMYANFFEGKSNINFDNPFVVLEMLELKNHEKLRRVVLLALLSRIHQAMYLSSREQLKSCIIDEAWDLLGDEVGNAAKFIEAGYRTARRHNGNFISITQSINDYYKNSTSQAAFINADLTVVLGQKPQDIDGLEKSERFPVDAFVKKLLKSLRMVDKQYSECVIQSPEGMSVHRIILAPYIRVLFSSKGDEFEMVRQLQQQGLSLDEAVAKVAENN